MTIYSSLKIASGDLSLTEKVIYWTAVLTPLWWLLGIQPLLYPLVMVGLLVANFSLSKCIRQPPPFFVLMWLLMAIVSLWTALLGLEEMQADLRTVAAAMVTFLKSYLMILACISLPFLTTIRIQVVTEAVSLMSAGVLVNLIVQMGLLAIGIRDVVYIPPLAKLIPGDVSTSLIVQTAGISKFYGIPLPRSILHTADPPILGTFAVLCTLVCLTEQNAVLKKIAIAGSISALILSFSRSSWVGIVTAGLILLAFRSSLFKQLSLWLSAAVFAVCSVLSLTIKQLLETPSEIFTSGRADSSEARALIVQKTVEASQEKILLGWGVIRGEVWLYDDFYLKLGSFSTYAAILYLNGLVGLTAFILSIGSTLLAFYQPALAGNFRCQISLASLLVLCALIQATPLSWMAIYLWFFFIWIGAVAAAEMNRSTAHLDWNTLLMGQGNQTD